MSENNPKSIEVLIAERIIRLAHSHKTLQEESWTNIDDSNWSEGRKDQIKDELEFLEQLQKSIS